MRRGWAVTGSVKNSSSYFMECAPYSDRLKMRNIATLIHPMGLKKRPKEQTLHPPVWPACYSETKPPF